MVKIWKSCDNCPVPSTFSQANTWYRKFENAVLTMQQSYSEQKMKHF